METTKINRYQSGKIYKIVGDAGETQIYIGSTTSTLSARMAQHRNSYKRWKNGEHHNITVFQLFDKFGIENCSILIIEDSPCSNKQELEKKEGEYIKSNSKTCVNRCIVGRTKRQYYVDNKDKIKDKMKEYYDEHKDDFLERNKKYNHNNKEKVIKYANEYRITNRDETRKNQNEKIQCPHCEKKISRANLKRHINAIHSSS